MGSAAFSAQYLLEPISAEDADFKDTDFQKIPAIPKGVRFNWYIGMDCARTKDRSNDRTGIAVVGVTDEFRFYVREAREELYDANEITQAIFFLHSQYEAALFCIEEDGFVTGWKKGFEEKCREARVFPRIEWIKSYHRDNKDKRILSTQGLARSKSIYVLPGSEPYVDQAVRFPRGRRNDILDAFANVYEVAQRASRKKVAIDDRPLWQRRFRSRLPFEGRPVKKVSALAI